MRISRQGKIQEMMRIYRLLGVAGKRYISIRYVS